MQVGWRALSDAARNRILSLVALSAVVNRATLLASRRLHTVLLTPVRPSLCASHPSGIPREHQTGDARDFTKLPPRAEASVWARLAV